MVQDCIHQQYVLGLEFLKEPYTYTPGFPVFAFDATREGIEYRQEDYGCFLDCKSRAHSSLVGIHTRIRSPLSLNPFSAGKIQALFERFLKLWVSRVALYWIQALGHRVDSRSHESLLHSGLSLNVETYGFQSLGFLVFRV